MKIDPKVQVSTNQSERVSTPQTNRAPAANSAQATPPAASQDTVSLSSAHAQVQKLATAAAQTPEVRSERVNALQQKVSSGQYKPASQDIADAILRQQTSGGSRAKS